jgi:predicted membrane metal-binding protein
MRNSGLFHILSISGLHMVIMAGTVFRLVTRSVIPSGNGRRERDSPLRCSTCFCPAPPCQRCAPGS